MKIGIKKRGVFGVKKISLEGKIEKIEKGMSSVSPGKEKMTFFIKGLEGLGVVSFSPREVEMMIEKTKKKAEKKLSESKREK